MAEKKTKAPPPRRPEPDTEPEAMPAAGPHAHPRLTNPDATPGAGVMPDIGPAQNTGGDVDGGAG
jgi:hypothetical protein